VITHVLDTSALLAHYFQESGAKEVNALWRTHAGSLGISALSIVELRGRLRESVDDLIEREAVVRLYTEHLTEVLDIDRKIAMLADQLREMANGRVPLIDAIIASTAKAHDAILVHRDPHFSNLAAGAVSLQLLPSK